jgi:hypothetical protein
VLSDLAFTATRKSRLFMAFLLGLATAFFYAFLIPDDPFWFDEVFTANLTTFRTSAVDVVKRVGEGDAHPPLYYLYAWACAKATGFWGSAVEGPPPGVERALRSCNLPIVALTGGAFGLLLPPPLAALGVGILLGTNTYAQKAVEARMYPMLGLFLLLAVAGALLSRPWLFGVSSLLAVYTHYLGLLFLAPLLLYVGVREYSRRGWKGLLPLAPLLLFLPWLPTFLQQMSAGTNAWVRPAPYLALYAYADLGSHLLVSLLLLGLLLVGVWQERRGPKALALLAIAAFPVLWATQATLGPNTASERYFGAFVPPLLFATLFGAPSKLLRLFFPGFALAALLSASAIWVNPPRFTEDYTLMASFLKKAEERGPLLVLGNERGRLISLRYYHRSESTFKLIEKEDVENIPSRFAVLYFGGASATNLGILGLELDKKAKELGYRRSLIPPGGGVVLAYYERPEKR